MKNLISEMIVNTVIPSKWRNTKNILEIKCDYGFNFLLEFHKSDIVVVAVFTEALRH